MTDDVQYLSGDGGYLECSSILREPRQRRVVSLVLESSQPLTERDLGIQLVAREEGIAPPDVSGTDRKSVQVDLHHRCLPKLEANGWIERSPEGIIAADSLPFGDDDSSLSGLCDSELSSWEAIAALHAQPRRQEIVSVIASQSRRTTLRELATELHRGSYAPWEQESDGDASSVLSVLHHIDLPKLAEVGLIEYDSDGNTIIRLPALRSLVNQTDISSR